MNRIAIVICLSLIPFGNMIANAQDSRSKLIARGKELELKKAIYKAPPGDAL